MPCFARILIDRTEGTLLDYSIPEALQQQIAVGSRVYAPLRRAEVMGTVLELHDRASFPGIKPLSRLVGVEEAPLLSPAIMKLAHWMADYYLAPLHTVLRSLLPGTVRDASLAEKTRRVVFLLQAPPDAVQQQIEKRAPQQKKILDLLIIAFQETKKIPVAYLLEKSGASASSLNALVKAGWAAIEEEIVARDPFAGDEVMPTAVPTLNADQERIVNILYTELEKLFDGSSPKITKPIFKLAEADERRGVDGAQKVSVHKVLEASSTGGTKPFAASVEFQDRFSLPFLLHGVTGSGKTEVYLRAIERALELGKSALVLVPEIALTPQTVERFRARFENHSPQSTAAARGFVVPVLESSSTSCTLSCSAPSAPCSSSAAATVKSNFKNDDKKSFRKGFIAVLHSHLSEGERHDEWLRLHRGEARIAIGARSAVFAPLQNLGLIIVDEEHESSYKQEETPRYHARDVAVVRARLEGCPIILGSATPSIESFHNTRTGKYRLLELPLRADHQRMPLVRILDLRLQVRGKGADGVLSFPLRQAISARLERSEQIILFLNRRGFASSVLCHQCGYVCECPQCSLSLTFHREANQLMCHLCGHTKKPPTACPECRDPGIMHAGIGTQRVEAAVQQAFPKARIVRMDTDTMKGKGSYRKTLDRFRSHQIDILIGTQMIAKGLDFPNVTLVGIINADTSLHAPDFRAGERTFQLLTQVAGRAGRGDREGEVMIQTFTPVSPSIQFARHHDYHGFFDQEIEFRKQFGYPPFQRMILVQLRGVLQEKVAFYAAALSQQLRKVMPDSVDVGEGMPAPLERAHGQYRFHIALKGASTKKMGELLRATMKDFRLPRGIIITVDIDPQSLM